MIISKNSVWKGAALFGLCLFAILSIIGCVNVIEAAYSQTPLEYKWSGWMAGIDCIAIVVAVVYAVIKLWKKWDDKD